MLTYIVVDLDGTLFNDRHRAPLAAVDDFASYHEAFEGDTINKQLLGKLRTYAMYPNNRIIILTGRPDRYRDRTVDFLASHDVPYHHLIMKPPAATKVPGHIWKVNVLREKKILPAFFDRRCGIVAFDNDVDIIEAYKRVRIPAELITLF